MTLNYKVILIIFVFTAISLKASSSGPFYKSNSYETFNFTIGKNLNRIYLNSLIFDEKIFFESNFNYSLSYNLFDDKVLYLEDPIISFGMYYIFNSYSVNNKSINIKYNEENNQANLSSNITFYQIGAYFNYNKRLYYSEFNELFVFIGPSFNFLLDSRSEEVTITSGDLQDYKITEESNYSDEAYNFMVTLRTGVDYLITEKPGFGLRLMYDFSLLNYYQNQKPLHSISVGFIFIPDGK